MLTFRTSDKAKSDKIERVIKRVLNKEYDFELAYTEIPLQSLDNSQATSAKGQQIKQEVQELKQMNNQDGQVQHQIIIDEIDEVGKAENQMDTTEEHSMPKDISYLIRKWKTM